MRDAAGELAEGFHLFGLPDAVLRRDLVGEIAEEAVEQDALAAAQRGDAEFGGEILAVAPQRADFAAVAENLALPGTHESVERRLQLAAFQFGDDQLDEVLAERVLPRPSEDLLGLRIPVQDASALVDLDEGIERGVDDAARQLLAFAQRLLRQPAFGHVAADEEIAPDRLRPGSHPGQHHDAPVLVDVARIGVLRALPAARQPQFPLADFQIVGVEEFAGVAADHFIGRISQDNFCAGADLNQDSLRIDHQDQILGGFENAATLLDLLAEGVLGSPAFGDVAGGFRCADDDALGRFDRRYAERDLDAAAVLAQALGFILFDRLAPADPAQDVAAPPPSGRAAR